MTSIVDVALRVRLEEAERERDEALKQARYAWERHAEKDRAYGDALRERDEARAALEKKVRGSDRLRAACMRFLPVAKRVIRERNEAYDVIDEINKELNGALGEASSEGESLVDGIRRLRRKTIAMVRQR